MKWAWRTWPFLGREVISPSFDTPAEAGAWRADNDRQHITLVVVDEQQRELRTASSAEFVEAVLEWDRGRTASTGGTEEVQPTVGG